MSPGPTVAEVFGGGRSLPLNYIERLDVDHKFREALQLGKHIVLYGSSKQGKTCLRNHVLKEDEAVVVQCQPGWKMANIHQGILEAAGFRLTQSERVSVASKALIRAELSGSAGFFGLVGAEGKGATEGTRESRRETSHEALELDLDDPGAVIRCLASIQFAKRIVLEDFHYLPEEVQQDFALKLKTFQEQSRLVFIVVGVWLEENRLILLNGDLTGRVISVDADRWSATELSRVIEKAEELLNIRYSKEFKARLLETAEGSVFLVQEVCHRACIRQQVTTRAAATMQLDGAALIGQLIADVLHEQRGRYRAFLSKFAEGFQSTELQMYRWLVWIIIHAEPAQLRQGLRQTDVMRKMRAAHPKGSELNPGNVAQALRSIASLQIRKGVRPPILDFSEADRRLDVVDRGFLVWLRSQKDDELAAELGLDDSPPE